MTGYVTLNTPKKLSEVDKIKRTMRISTIFSADANSGTSSAHTNYDCSVVLVHGITDIS